MSDVTEREDEWEDLIDRHLRGELTAAEMERLAELIDGDESLRKEFVESVQWDTTLTEAMRVGTDDDNRNQDVFLTQPARAIQPASATRLLRSLLAAAVAVIVTLALVLFYEKDAADSAVTQDSDALPTASVAKITGLSGALIWTGDRGEIERDIKVGTELAGGTIEGMAPDSWFELRFHDGSKVMISGTSMLTFADAGQKQLRLREGRLSADVAPQPVGKPMLIHTRTALLSVLGTQFEVEAGLVSTALNVSEGRVRIRRLSDGSEVDVPAQHLVIADGERELTPERVPDSVNRWTSELNLRGDHYGKWMPATDGLPAALKAIPLIPPGAPHITLHLAGLSVGRPDDSQVVVQPESRFIVRGLLKTDARVFFGIRVSYRNGEFAGMFRGDLLEQQPLAARGAEGQFEEVFELQNFTLDPAVHDKRDQLATRPDDLVLDGVWAFTHTDEPSGLMLTEVKLLSSVD